MTPHEYVLRAWELEIVPDLERKYGWSTYTCWQVYQAVKAKQPLMDVYRTDQRLLRKDGIVKRVATQIQTEYLGWLKRIEKLEANK